MYSQHRGSRDQANRNAALCKACQSPSERNGQSPRPETESAKQTFALRANAGDAEHVQQCSLAEPKRAAFAAASLHVCTNGIDGTADQPVWQHATCQGRTPGPPENAVRREWTTQVADIACMFAIFLTGHPLHCGLNYCASSTKRTRLSSECQICRTSLEQLHHVKLNRSSAPTTIPSANSNASMC